MRRKRDCDAGTLERAAWVRRHMPAYLAAHHLTHEYLAHYTGVCRTTITKFLDGYPDFEPTPGSTLMKLLETLEALLQSDHLIAYRPLTLPELQPLSDDYVAAFNHREMVKGLLRDPDYRSVLRMMGGPSSTAIHSALPHRAAECIFDVLAIEMLVCKPSIRPIGVDLLKETVRRIDQLSTAALRAAPHAIEPSTRREAVAKVGAYGGCALSYCGYYMCDEALFLRGLKRQLKVVPLQEELEQGYWNNLFVLCGVLLREKCAWAARAVDAATRTADRHWTKLVQETIVTHLYPELVAHWRSTGAAILLRSSTT